MMFNFDVNQHLVLCAGQRRFPAADEGDGRYQASPGDGAVGPVPAQSRRTRSRPPHRETAANGVRRVRSGKEYAALPARNPPPARAHAAGRPPPPGTCLQPDDDAAGHARDSLWRRDRHGRRPATAGAELRAHPHAVVHGAERWLHQERQADSARHQRGRLRLSACECRRAAPRSQLAAQLDGTHHSHAQGSPRDRMGRFLISRDRESQRCWPCATTGATIRSSAFTI